MSKKNCISRQLTKPCIVQLTDQLYAQSAKGEMIRVNKQGQKIPRIRMRKKEKLKLRKDFHKINEMDSYELANKIVDSVKSVLVVNPKKEEQLKNERREIAEHA
jgi:hypothetical protein